MLYVDFFFIFICHEKDFMWKHGIFGRTWDLNNIDVLKVNLLIVHRNYKH